MSEYTKEKSKKNLKISLVFNLMIVVMEVVALVISGSSHGTRMFEFYTEDSNLFALAASAVCVGYTWKCLGTGELLPRWVSILKYLSVCCLTVTFVVVVCVLAPMEGGLKGYQHMMLENSMLYHHFLCPVLSFVSFLFFDGVTELKASYTRIALIPTVLYATITVILNLAKVIEGPYPFLRVYDQPVFMSVIWCVVIVGGAYGLACLIRWLRRKVLGDICTV